MWGRGGGWVVPYGLNCFSDILPDSVEGLADITHITCFPEKSKRVFGVGGGGKEGKLRIHRKKMCFKK